MPGRHVTTGVPPARERLGKYTAREVEELYMLDSNTLKALRKAGVLHAVAPTGLKRPLLYDRAELDAVICGAAPAKAGEGEPCAM